MASALVVYCATTTALPQSESNATLGAKRRAKMLEPKSADGRRDAPSRRMLGATLWKQLVLVRAEFAILALAPLACGDPSVTITSDVTCSATSNSWLAIHWTLCCSTTGVSTPLASALGFSAACTGFAAGCAVLLLHLLCAAKLEAPAKPARSATALEQ